MRAMKPWSVPDGVPNLKSFTWLPSECFFRHPGTGVIYIPAHTVRIYITFRFRMAACEGGMI